MSKQEAFLERIKRRGASGRASLSPDTACHIPSSPPEASVPQFPESGNLRTNPALLRLPESTHGRSNSAARLNAHDIATNQTLVPAGKSHHASKQLGRELKRPRLIVPPNAQPFEKIPAQGDQTMQQATVSPQTELTEAGKYIRCVPQIRTTTGDDHCRRQPNHTERCSEQSSEGFKTAVENMPDERDMERGREMQSGRTDASSSGIAGHDNNDEAEKCQKYRENRDDDERDGQDSEEESNENLCAQDCDWGTNGGDVNVDWERINAEDREFRDDHDTHMQPADHGDEDGNEDGAGPISNQDTFVRKPRTLEDADYCQNTEDEQEAIEQQRRLSQRSAKEAARRKKHRGAAGIPEASAGEPKAHATRSEMHQPVPAHFNRSRSTLEGRASSLSGPSTGKLRAVQPEQDQRPFISSPVPRLRPDRSWPGSSDVADPQRLRRVHSQTRNRTSESNQQRGPEVDSGDCVATRESKRAFNRWQAGQSEEWEATYGAAQRAETADGSLMEEYQSGETDELQNESAATSRRRTGPSGDQGVVIKVESGSHGGVAMAGQAESGRRRCVRQRAARTRRRETSSSSSDTSSSSTTSGRSSESERRRNVGRRQRR
jgi:hypothetical protein